MGDDVFGKIRPTVSWRNLVAAVTLPASLVTASAAHGQSCVLPPPFPAGNVPAIGSSPASVSSMISSVVTSANTAFLLQSTTFVGSPPGAKPEQQGGGIWSRVVGGNISENSSTNTHVALTPFFGGTTATVTCEQKVDESFAGIQFGSDIAKLNTNEWNIHIGSTAGYLESSGKLAEGAFGYVDPASGLPAGGGPLNNTTGVPFIGLYGAVTRKGFFADALFRAEYYQTDLTAPGANLFGQAIDAYGYSFSSSGGYNYQIPNSNWFIEPSAAIILSRTKVAPFNYVTSGTQFVNSTGQQASTIFPGTLQLKDIGSDIGRIGLRIGTTVQYGGMIWQPFGAISVWREFGPDVTSSYATSSSRLVSATSTTMGSLLSATSVTSTFGTFGQYSLGVSGQISGTGWLGFIRLDYRDGANLQGLSGTGGIRYQFTPETVARRLIPVKGPVQSASGVRAVNWTGLYIGGFGGAGQGFADWGYVSGDAVPHIGGYVLGSDIGYNYQINRWVLGIEAEAAKTRMNGGTACNPFGSVSPYTPMANVTCDAWLNWTATGTARLGYTWDRALFFVKGGTAWSDENFAATCNFPHSSGSFPVQCQDPANAPLTDAIAGISRWGWVIGLGSEFALTANWSAKAEYDYINFGDSSTFASDSTDSRLHTLINGGMRLSEAKIGLNYRFGGGTDVTSH